MAKKYYLFVVGCQMNKSDAERLAGVLDELGYEKTDEENQADLIITVACSVRQSAVDRIYGKLNLWNKIKKERPLTTILTGCILPFDKTRLQSAFDLIFDINDLPRLTEQLGSNDLNRCPLGSGEFPARRNSSEGGIRRLADFNYLDIDPEYFSSFRAHVPISTGCNNYCSYCVVPYVRGPEKSRPAKEIIDECKNLIERGYKKIILIGQNVNSYGQDLKNGIKFPNLLKTINDLPGNFWLRFATSHPKDMSDELIKTVADGDKICKYIHLPVQAGDDEILKKMNRKYSREHYLGLIKKIRQMIPDAAIGTDVIVGYPSETKQQFKNTVKLFKEAKFDMAYIAQYSPRLGTAAYQMTDDVPKEEKMKREKILTKVLEKTALEHNKKLVGKTMDVLIEEVKIKDKGLKINLIGKTRTFKTVKIATNRAADSQVRAADSLAVSYVGQFIKVKITKARSFGLEVILAK